LAATLAGSVGVLSAERGYVRPPGALRPREFTARCLRCSICVQVCPTKAIRLLDIGLDMKNISTPVIDTRFDGCIAWGEQCQLCAEKCPTGALSPVAEIQTHKIGLAGLDTPRCTNCMVCFRRCPIPGAVLFPNPAGEPFRREKDIPLELKTVNSPLKPYINREKCVGCGLCVAHCIPKIMHLEPLEVRI